MTEDIEKALRQALQPEEPAAGFADRVLARLPGNGATAAVTIDSRRRTRRWLPAALAASLLIAVALRQVLVERHEQQTGRQARQQVIEALRVTSAKLDLAYQAVLGQPPAPTGEENHL